MNNWVWQKKTKIYLTNKTPRSNLFDLVIILPNLHMPGIKASGQEDQFKFKLNVQVEWVFSENI